MPRSESTPLTLLQVSLDVAVPLAIQELQRRSWAEIAAEAPVCAQIIAEHGDHVLYRGKKPGETAAAFTALARAIATCAFMPGGITIFDRHFEAQHPEHAQ